MAEMITNAPMNVPEEFMTFLCDCMKSFQCSAHDMAHVERVASLALHIASVEGQNQSKREIEADGSNTKSEINMKVVYIGALCHDVLDSKLVTAETARGNEKALRERLMTFMTDSECEEVFKIIHAVGYKKLLDPNHQPQSRSIEYRCVQDADLLDAIGAVGIGRCYSFGGGRNRDLFGLKSLKKIETSEDYMMNSHSQDTSNLQHFFDKLLRIHTMMTTAEGRRMAECRHNAMGQFLRVLAEELCDAGCDDGKILNDLLEDRI